MKAIKHVLLVLAFSFLTAGCMTPEIRENLDARDVRFNERLLMVQDEITIIRQDIDELNKGLGETKATANAMLEEVKQVQAQNKVEFEEKLAVILEEVTRQYNKLAAQIMKIEGESYVEGVYHIVNEGDNLWNIARKYGTTMQAIVDANDALKTIEDGKRMRPGIKLFIPDKRE